MYVLAPTPDSISRIFLLLGLLLPTFAQHDVVLASTDPDIVYNPPLCASSSTLANCSSPWQISNDTIPGTTIVYSNGPIPQAGNAIPQMFLNFRASALYLNTTNCSNATINFTLTAEPSDVSITTQVNTSIGLIVAVNLPETQTTTLGITFLQGDIPSRFGVQSITLTVTNTSATSSFLPSPSLPGSSYPSTVIPFPSTSSIPNTVLGVNDNRHSIFGTLLCAIGTLLLV